MLRCHVKISKFALAIVLQMYCQCRLDNFLIKERENSYLALLLSLAFSRYRPPLSPLPSLRMR